MIRHYLAKKLDQPMLLLLMASGIAGLVGWLIHPQGLVILAGLICVQVLGMIGPWLNLHGCRGKVEGEVERATEGETVAVRVTLVNRSWLPSWAVTVESEGRLACGVSYVGARKTWSETRRFRAERRGRMAHRGQMSSAFPFGVWRRNFSIECPCPIIVWPRILPVPTLPDTEGVDRHDGERFQQRVGIGGDFLAVRPYRRGDALRHIHWAQTARHDQLVVCEFQAPVRPTVMIFVDTDAVHHHGDGAYHSLEWCLRIAASFVAGWIDEGIPVGLRMGGATFPAESGARHRKKLLDALALFDADLPCPSFVEGLEEEEQGSEIQIVIATTAGLLAMAARHWRPAQRHFVALGGPAFVPGDVEFPLPARPWIEINDPRRVAEQLAHPTKEVRHAW